MNTSSIRSFILLGTLFLLSSTLLAQPVPAAKQAQPIVISGGTAHLGNGQIIENAMIAFENGKLALVNTLAVGRGFSSYKIINATGKHIYPGFIALTIGNLLHAFLNFKQTKLLVAGTSVAALIAQFV